MRSRQGGKHAGMAGALSRINECFIGEMIRMKKIEKWIITFLCLCVYSMITIMGISLYSVRAKADRYIAVDLTKASCSYFAKMDESTAVHTTRIAVCKSDFDWGHNLLQITAPSLHANIFINGKSVEEIQTEYVNSGSPSIDTSDVIIKEYGCAPVYVYFTYVNGYNVIDVCIPEDYLSASALQSVEIAGEFTFVNEGFEKNVYTLTGKFAVEKQVQVTTHTVLIDGVSQIVEDGKFAKRPETDPIKEETETCQYTFLGWFIKDMGAPFDFSTPITSSIELEARFKETKKYLVTIDGVSQRVLEGSLLTKPQEPIKESTQTHDYLFQGWKYEGGFWQFDTDHVSSDLTLTASFAEIEKKQYTVTWNPDNGEAVSILSVYEGNTIPASKIPQSPTKVEEEIEYTFYFWSADGINAFDFSTLIKGDITLIAIYESTPIYTVQIGESIQKVKEGECAARPLMNPTKLETESAQYTFIDWFIEDMGTPFDFSTPITKNVVLYAEFKETKKYLVTIDGVSQRVLEGECAIPPTTKPTKAEDDRFVYLFEGWENIVTNKLFDFKTPVQSDLILQAKFFSIQKYTVSIDGVEFVVLDGEKLRQPTEVPVKPATESHTFLFIGWGYVNGQGEVTHWNFEEDTVQSDLLLTADFQAVEKQKYKVTFDPDNGVTPTEIWVYEGALITSDRIPEEPSKLQNGHTRYAFNAWSADGLVAWDFERTPIYEDVVLRAYYAETTVYTVSFDGIVYTYEADSYLQKPTDPTKDSTKEYEYLFLGWYYWSEEGLRLWDFEKDRVAFDVALIAKFEARKVCYTIKIHYGPPSNFVVTQKVAWGETIIYPELIQQPGYEMLGWVDDEGKTAPVLMPLEDVCVYANWQIATYTVTVQCSTGENHYERFTMETIDTLSSRLNEYFFNLQSALYTYSWRTPLPKEFDYKDYTFYIEATKVRYRLTITEDPERVESTETFALDWGEEIVTFTPEPVRGKRFLGWKTENGEEVPAQMPTNNLTIVGIWEWDVYTLIVIDGEGKSHEHAYTAKEADDALYVKALFNAYLLPTDTSAYRYSWKDTIPELLPLENGKVYKIEKIAKVYTLTFISAEEVQPITFTVETLPTLQLPETPGKIGYTAKWDKEVSELTLEDATLTAVYTPITYTLTFAGVVQIEPITFTVETMDKLALPEIPKKKGYTSKWDKTLSDLGLADTTITAIYTPIVYTLTFVAEKEVESVSFTVETLSTLLLPQVPEKAGYEGEWEVEKEELLLEDRTITAVYTALQYTITFVGVEGVGSIAFNVENLPYLSFPEVPAKAGYTGHWDRLPSEIKAENTVVTAIYTPITYTITFIGLEKDTFMTFTVETKDGLVFPIIPGRVGYLAVWDKQPNELLLENTTVSVVYTPIVYTLTLLGVEMEPITFTVETMNEVSLPTLPKREGYTAKWDKNLSDIGLESATVTAIYTPIVYTITFVSEEGSAEQTFTVETLENLELPTPPTKEGYTVSWDKTKADIRLQDAIVTAVYTKIIEEPVDSSVTETESSSSEREESSTSEIEETSSSESQSSASDSSEKESSSNEERGGCAQSGGCASSGSFGFFFIMVESLIYLCWCKKREE